ALQLVVAFQADLTALCVVKGDIRVSPLPADLDADPERGMVALGAWHRLEAPVGLRRPRGAADRLERVPRYAHQLGPSPPPPAPASTAAWSPSARGISWRRQSGCSAPGARRTALSAFPVSPTSWGSPPTFPSRRSSSCR